MATVAFFLRESNATMRNATRKNVVMEEGKVIPALSQSSFIPTSCAHLTLPGLDNLTTTAQIGQILGVL